MTPTTPTPARSESQSGPTIPPDREHELTLRLTRAGELLRADRLGEATAEIEAALGLWPGDLRTRNLLGLLHFRAGRYPEAREVYRQLLGERADDPSLRLNLGLVELRMGHHSDAIEHLGWVVEAEPENTRAQGYLGLALMKAGDLHKAKQVLFRAGQEDLLRQVDLLLAGQAAEPPGEPRAKERPASVPPPLPKELREAAAPELLDAAATTPIRRRLMPESNPMGPFLGHAPPIDRDGRHAMAEARRAVDAGAQALEDEQPFQRAEAIAMPAREGAEWQVRGPAQGLPPPSASSNSPLRPIPLPKERTHASGPNVSTAQVAQPLLSFLRGQELSPPTDGSSFGVTPEGLLLVRVFGSLPTRSIGVVVSSGELNFEPIARRSRGRVLDETFGAAADGLFRATGNGVMIISPRGGVFVALALADESIYVRESVAFAFEDSLHFENGRLPGAGPAPGIGYTGLPEALGKVVQLRGKGQVVLRTERPLFTVRLPGGQTSFIEVERLAGWTGRIIPGLMMDDSGAPTPYVECTGEGFLLVEPPAAEEPPIAPGPAA